MQLTRLITLCLVIICGGTMLSAQSQKALTLEEAVARDINGTPEQQDRPFPPHRIMGNIYYVGTETQASFLVSTPEGLILINSNFERHVPIIRKAVEQLGFKFTDIKILLGSHAHADHQEGDALVKELTGAQVMAMAEDVPLLERIRPGGKAHPIDKILNHLDTVTLGGATLTAHHTGGHTAGATLWTMKVTEGRKSYDVVILSGLGAPNGMVGKDGKFTPLVATMMGSFAYHKAIPCDVFLGSHSMFYNMTAKYATLHDNPSLIATPRNPFIDPQGYLNEIGNYERVFSARLVEQKKAAGDGSAPVGR